MVKYLEIELMKEQKEAFEMIMSSIGVSKQRAPIFIYGKAGIGKTMITEKLKKCIENVQITSVKEKMNKLLYTEKSDEEDFKRVIKNNFLLKYSPETFLEEIFNDFSNKDILVINQLENVVTNRIDETLMVDMNFDFGINSDIAMNGKIIWVFPENAFLNYNNHWKQTKSSLMDCSYIKVLPPSANSLQEYFNNNRLSEEYEISSEEIEKCLNNKFYYTMKIRNKRKLR